jgi:hypothetical protein
MKKKGRSRGRVRAWSSSNPGENDSTQKIAKEQQYLMHADTII